MSSPKTKKGKILKTVLILILICALVLAFFFIRNKRKLQAQISDVTYVEEAPAKRSIIKTLTGSGTLQPANSFYVTSLVSGEILECTFEEGDIVEKDSVLYQIDSSDSSSSLERANISYDQTQRAYADTVDSIHIKAKTAGQVVSLNVAKGDYVNMNQVIGTVRDSSVMTLKVPFASDDAQKFYPGQGASVMLDGSFETLPGTVTAISGADIMGTGNMLTRNVTIEVSNPGALSEGQAATAVIDGIGSSSSSTFTYRSSSMLTALVPGEVTAINVSEGGFVKKDQTVVTLGGKDIDDMIKKASESLRTAQLSMDSTRDQLDNYTIEAPISGTIVDKSFKPGDNASQGKTLCTIYDLSYLEMILNIDELDIMSMRVGQNVVITADAVEGREFSAIVTKVSVAGTTMGGATTYPVTIRIDEADGLLPGMNVDATIIIDSADDVLTIPNGALNRGDLVLVTKDSPSAVNAEESSTAPEGYVYVKVETGLSDDSHVQILSGLTENDNVAYRPQGAAGNSWINMFGGMSGMTGGGQAPAAGGPGSGPQGRP